jgi:hypothetical protein
MLLHALLVINGNDREAYFFSNAKKADAATRARISAMGLDEADFNQPFNGRFAVTNENDLFLAVPVEVDGRGLVAMAGDTPLINPKIDLTTEKNTPQYFGLIIEDDGAFQTRIFSSHANAKTYSRQFMVERGVPVSKIDELFTDDGAFGVVFHGVIRPVEINGAGMDMAEPITDDDRRKTDLWLADKLRSEIMLLEGFWQQFGGETVASRHLHDRFHTAIAALTKCVGELEGGEPVEEGGAFMAKIQNRWSDASNLINEACSIAMANFAAGTAGNA